MTIRQSDAIVLDFIDPAISDRRTVGAGRQARVNKCCGGKGSRLRGTLLRHGTMWRRI